jgi:hypothetical protein
MAVFIFVRRSVFFSGYRGRNDVAFRTGVSTGTIIERCSNRRLSIGRGNNAGHDRRDEGQ